MVLHDQSNEEEGIWKTQSKAARKGLKETDGLRKQHERGIKYINRRILHYFLSLICLVVLAIWATASSPYLTYGSLIVLILATIAWGGLRIRRISQLKELRQRQVRETRDKSSQ